MTSQDLPREPGDLHFALIQLMARERVTSLRREAERPRCGRLLCVRRSTPLAHRAEALAPFGAGV
jgi:hypothetical protein